MRGIGGDLFAENHSVYGGSNNMVNKLQIKGDNAAESEWISSETTVAMEYHTKTS